MIKKHQLVKEILFDKNQINIKTKELAQKVSKFYENNPTPVILVGILRGCIPFLNDLMLKMDIDCAIDFMYVESYSGQTAAISEPKIRMDVFNNVKNRDILIVEDIIDSGRTLLKIRQHLLEKGAKTVKIITFLDKKVKRIAPIEADWFGYEVPDYFLVGYGLDYNEILRNLPYVAIADLDEINRLEGN